MSAAKDYLSRAEGNIKLALGEVTDAGRQFLAVGQVESAEFLTEVAHGLSGVSLSLSELEASIGIAPVVALV